MCKFFFVSLLIVSAFSRADNFRDPSTPLFKASEPVKQARKVSPKKTYVLSSVFIGANQKIAMINDKEYREGDVIGPYRVKKISRHNVVIRSASTSKLLELYPVDKTGFTIK